MDDPKHPDEMLEAYLDGLLPPDQHAQMEARIANDPELKAQCELQTILNTSLAQQFAPPSPPTALGIPRPNHPAKSWPRVVAIAAIVILGVGVGIWALNDYLTPKPPNPYAGGTYNIHRPPTTFVDEYHALVQGGFKPDWVCQTQEQFVQTFQSNLGQGLIFETNSSAVRMVGLSYANVLSEQTIIFLGIANDTPALVFVDRLQNDRPQTLPERTGLHLFRAQIGELVLYELTPLDKPTLLSGFHPSTPQRPLPAIKFHRPLQSIAPRPTLCHCGSESHVARTIRRAKEDINNLSARRFGCEGSNNSGD
ncbi:MAG: hypothetical protein IT447_12745 [Phycisphaerales bacterium]|nr:hypothetical protein [Phycisphaerales bacterium]